MVALKQALYQRIMVGLDMTTYDQQVLGYLSAISPLLGAEEAYFTHIVPDFEKTPYLPEQDPDHSFPNEERILDILTQEVKLHVPTLPLKPYFEVKGGRPTSELIRRADVNEADLMLLGHKKELFSSSGLSSRRMLRHLPIDMCFVPPGYRTAPKRIVVATDFSQHAAWAIQKAAMLAMGRSDVEIFLVHVYDLPKNFHMGYSKTDSQYEGYVRTTLAEFQARHLQGLDLLSAPISPVFIPREGKFIAQQVVDFAREQEADLIMIGAQGHSDLTGLILGSTTERIFLRGVEIPLWVVRTPVN